MKNMLIVKCLVVALGLPIIAQAELIDHGNGLIYDTVQNITWYDAPRVTRNQPDSVLWATNLSVTDVNGVSITGWRLPSTMATGGGAVIDSEMADLYYNGLGNTYGNFVNSGPFVNLVPNDITLPNLNYWTGNLLDGNPGVAWDYHFQHGFQHGDPKGNLFYALAVHDGKVGEPIDTDSDGTLDCNDNCPTDINKIQPGICGCGVADTDSDGDGTADCLDQFALEEIISTSSNGILYWDVAASGWTQMTSSTPTGDIAAKDFTGDGIADVASCWDSGLWYQDGASLAWTKVTGSAPDSLTAGDVTGDGRSEIIGTWSSGIWYWDEAESKWTQMATSTPTGDIAAKDFTGDGIADVASCWDSGLWYQDGASLAWTKITGSAPDSLTAGDVTGDGRSEIIGTWSSGIWYWDVPESEWTKMSSSVPSGDITAGDFNGDGIADVASCWDSGLWYQDGTTFGWTKVSGAAPDSVTAGDVTGD